MIPLGAVIPLEEGKAVYVVEGDQAQRRLITLGFMKGTRVYVLSGLDAGDKLIVAGHRYVAPNQKVLVVSGPEESLQLADPD